MKIPKLLGWQTFIFELGSTKDSGQVRTQLRVNAKVHMDLYWRERVRKDVREEVKKETVGERKSGG